MTGNRTKILVVEDEPALREPLEYQLVQEGFEVSAVADGKEALEAFASFHPDLVLLDVMLPGISGTEVCRRLRTESNVPVIMLSAKDSEIDKVVGLELGADDYLAKPYSFRELLARVRAILRRQEMENAATPKDQPTAALVIGPVRLDPEAHSVSVNGQPVALPLKEFELLETLMSHAGRVLTRAQLISEVWGASYFGDTKTLDVHIKRLRAKIEPHPSRPTYLQTVRGLGYKFTAPN